MSRRAATEHEEMPSEARIDRAVNVLQKQMTRTAQRPALEIPASTIEAKKKSGATRSPSRGGGNKKRGILPGQNVRSVKDSPFQECKKSFGTPTALKKLGCRAGNNFARVGIPPTTEVVSSLKSDPPTEQVYRGWPLRATQYDLRSGRAALRQSTE